MLLLGVLAAQAEAAGPSVDSDFDLLQTVTVDGASSTATISFTDLVASYGSTYQHLQLRLSMQDTDALGNMQNLFLKLDAATGSKSHYLEGDGSAASSDYKTDAYIRIRAGSTKHGDTYGFSASVIDILDAFETTKYKTVRYLSGNVASTSALIALGSGYRAESGALDEITLDGNDNIDGFSRASLYGIKVS